MATNFRVYFGNPSGVASEGESLAAGDLTTAFAQWRAANGYFSNEQIRAALNAHYGTSHTDIQPNLARFLRDRQ